MRIATLLATATLVLGGAAAPAHAEFLYHFDHPLGDLEFYTSTIVQPNSNPTVTYTDGSAGGLATGDVTFYWFGGVELSNSSDFSEVRIQFSPFPLSVGTYVAAFSIFDGVVLTPQNHGTLDISEISITTPEPASMAVLGFGLIALMAAKPRHAKPTIPATSK